MRSFYPEGLAYRDLYRLLCGSVVPRPVAWVSTVNDDGTFNLAPFSFFTVVSVEPPLLAITMARRFRDQKKDSLRNIELHGEFVVNIASDSMAQAMSVSAKEFPYGVSEFEATGLTPVASERIAAPRVLEAPISMECRRHAIVEVGNGPHAIVMGEIVAWHFRSDVANEQGRVDFDALRPLARLAGPLYASFGPIIYEDAWELTEQIQPG